MGEGKRGFGGEMRGRIGGAGEASMATRGGMEERGGHAARSRRREVGRETREGGGWGREEERKGGRAGRMRGEGEGVVGTLTVLMWLIMKSSPISCAGGEWALARSRW